MVLATKEPSDIDVGSLTNILAQRGFTPKEVRAHLESYKLPVPDMTRVSAFQKNAEAVEEEIAPVLRDAALRLGSVPTIDEESWLLVEAARNVGDERISDVILEGGSSPDPETPPKSINPKAMAVWKKMFKEHGEEISKAKKAKQWGVAVSIFKNLSKKEGYEPFIDKAAWTLDSLTPLELSTAVTTLTALAENLDLLGHEDLADQVDILTADFEARLSTQEKQASLSMTHERIAMKKDMTVMDFDDFCLIVAQALDVLKNRDFSELFSVAAAILRKHKHAYLHDVKQHYSIYAELFEEDKELYKTAPPEALEEELFEPFLGYVHDALIDTVRVVGGDEYYDEDAGIPPINRVKLKNYLKTDYVSDEIYKVVSRHPLWRDQFGL